MGSPSDIQGFKALLTGDWQRFPSADTHRPTTSASGVEGKRWVQARYDVLLAPVHGIPEKPDEAPYRNQVQFVRAAEAGELVDFARALGIELEVRS